ncbi:MAG: hypothetical protein JXB29_09210 [Sedimentisphaerales bacterium]|nr:hypothetical protein [Sedimentisphaerales bacterium]
MDLSSFKDLARRVSFFRSYSSLVLPAVIAMVAVVILVLSLLMGSKLKEQIETESISSGARQIESQSSGAIPRDQWKLEQQYQKKHEEDFNQISLFVKQTTQRELLSYKVFPEPKDKSILIFEEFGRNFYKGIDGLIAGVAGQDCPTEAELERRLKGYVSSRSRGRRRNLRSMSQDDISSTIIDEICLARAESACVYVNLADIPGYEYWQEYEYVGVDKAVQDCWYGQLAYWIIEDVFQTIASANSNSESVLKSPVKRLMGIGFSSEKSRRGQEVPNYVLSIDDGLTEPHTGRFCNDEIDVVHFTISVVVETKAVFRFMQELCSGKEHKFKGYSGQGREQTFRHNQITILNTAIVSIDPKAPDYEETHGLYRYGEQPVVKLDMACEYIFNKQGYEQIQPEQVKQLAEEK